MKTLEEVLINAIEKTEGAIGATVDFAVEQAPEVIQQAIMWHMSRHIVLIITGILLLLLIRPIINFSNAKSDTADRMYKGEWKALGGISAVLISIISFMMIIGHLLGAIKICIAPKLWLIEYAASLAK